jgi:hypothetical protein
MPCGNKAQGQLGAATDAVQPDMMYRIEVAVRYAPSLGQVQLA